MSQQPSGIDLARAALAAARADAKTRPTQPQRKKPRTRTSSRRPGDPTGLGAAITGMILERGWQPPEANGSILDQWPAIAPNLAGKVHAERFEHDTGTLHLRPVSDAYATQLRLYQAQILAKVQQAPSGTTVRALKILPVGVTPGPPATGEPAAPTARELPPVRTRETACPGYREARALNLGHKLVLPAADPYQEEARQRQIAALRANRLPETETADIDPVHRRKTDSMAASERAALAYKRRQAAGDGEPRRSTDVA